MDSLGGENNLFLLRFLIHILPFSSQLQACPSNLRLETAAATMTLKMSTKLVISGTATEQAPSLGDQLNWSSDHIVCQVTP